MKNKNSGVRNFLHEKIISVWECLSLHPNLQNRCHPLNILLTQISSSFSATQIPSFLLTDTLVSSLTHTHIHTHWWASFKHVREQALPRCRSFLCECVLWETQRLHLSIFVNTRTQYRMCGADTRCESDSHRLQIFPVPWLEELVSQHGRVKTWGIKHTHTRIDEVGFHSDLSPLSTCQGINPPLASLVLKLLSLWDLMENNSDFRKSNMKTVETSSVKPSDCDCVTQLCP